MVGGALMTVGAVSSMTGTMSGLMLTGPRVTYALAQNQQLPPWFGAIHPRFRTPYFSILFLGVVSLGLALSGTFVQLAGLAAIARLLQYIATCVAVIKLHKEMQSDSSRFQLPGKHAIPLLATILCSGLLFQSKANQVYLIAAALSIGALLFWLADRFGKRRTAVPVGR